MTLSSMEHLGTDRQCTYVHPDTAIRCERHVVVVRHGKDAVYGTRCGTPRHGGPRQKKRLIAEMQAIKVRKTAHKLGRPVEISGEDAIQQLVWEANGNVAILREHVRHLQTPKSVDPYAEYPELFFDRGQQGKLSAHDQKKSALLAKLVAAQETGPSGGPNGSETFSSPASEAAVEAAEELTPELFGPDHLGDMAPHVLINLYNGERDRLLRYAKEYVNLGIEERRTRIAENQVRVFLQALDYVISHPLLALDNERKLAARQLMAEQMRLQAAPLPAPPTHIQAEVVNGD